MSKKIPFSEKQRPDEEAKPNGAKNIVGKRLLELRKSEGLTQKQIADELGVTTKTYRSWEKGGAIRETLMLNALSKLFNISCDYLLVKTDYLTIEAKEVSEITGLSDPAVKILKEEKGMSYPLSAPLGEMISRLLLDYKANGGRSVIASLDRYARITWGSTVTINGHTGEPVPAGGLTGEDYYLSDIALKGVESAAVQYRMDQLKMKGGE